MSTSETPKVSDPGTRIGGEDELDQLVQRASTPSLATLFQRGKDAGLIKPGKEYGNA